MTRRALAACVAAVALVAFPAGSAWARSDDADKPVVFLSGSETGAPVNCGAAWDRMWKRLRQLEFRSGGEVGRWRASAFTSVGTNPSDRGCGTALEGGDTVHGMARAFAAWLHRTHGADGRAVDVVAHGTGGIVLRYALGMSARRAAGFDNPMYVEDAVTLCSPHGGSAVLRERCGPVRMVCREMDPGTAEGAQLFATLGEEGFARPAGRGGTDWTVIGSKGDEFVDGDSAIAMEAQHKLVYQDEGLTHAKLLTDTDEKRDAKLVWQHGNGPVTQWNRAPHVADRGGLALVYGREGGAGSGGGGGCTGYNDERGGPTAADPRGIVEWPGARDKLLSYIEHGLVEAYADCFTKIGARRYESAGVVRLNGLDFTPAAGETVVIDLGEEALLSKHVSVSLPSRWFGGNPIPIMRERNFKWLLPHRSGAVNEDEGDRLFKTTPGGEIAALPILHELAVELRQGSVQVDVKLGMPKALGGEKDGGGEKDDDGPSLETTLVSTNADGLKLDRIKGKVQGELKLKGVKLGAGVEFEYSIRENQWKAAASVAIPWKPYEPEIKGGVTVKDGSLQAAELEFTGSVPLGTSGLFLQRAAVEIVIDPVAVKFGVGVGVGPKVFPTSGGTKSVVDFSTNLTVSSEAVKLDGEVNVIGTKWGEAELEAKFYGSGVTWKATIGPELELENRFVGRIEGRLQAKVAGAIDSNGIDASARLSACFDVELRLVLIPLGRANRCLDGTLRMTASSRQIALSGCGMLEIDDDRYLVGFGLKRPSGRSSATYETDVMAGACDFADWHAVPSRAAGLRATATQQDVRVGDSEGGALIGVVGRDAAPHVSLSGPGGQTVPAPAEADGIVRGDGYAMIHSPATRSTYVLLSDARPGAWRVQAQPGSSALETVRTADSLPEPRVRARVRRGRGGKRVVRYSLRSIPGQRVVFSEVGRNVRRTIGAARGPRGTLRFRPAFGPRGRRRIMAAVTQDGFPRTRLRVARYVAPRPPMPAAPRKVKLRRRGARLVASWTRVRHAAAYLVRVRVPGGQVYSFEQAARRRRAVVRRVPRGRARVTVRALRRDGRAGPPRRASTRARR